MFTTTSILQLYDRDDYWCFLKVLTQWDIWYNIISNVDIVTKQGRAQYKYINITITHYPKSKTIYAVVSYHDNHITYPWHLSAIQPDQPDYAGSWLMTGCNVRAKCDSGWESNKKSNFFPKQKAGNKTEAIWKQIKLSTNQKQSTNQ